MGWWPPATFTIVSRRMPKPKSPSVSTPSSSGPRWAIVAHMARSTASSTGRPPRAYQPAIPHTLRALAGQLAHRPRASSTVGEALTGPLVHLHHPLRHRLERERAANDVAA